MATQARRLRQVFLGGAALLLAGCEAQLKPSGISIASYIVSVTDGSGTISATLQHGFAPSPNGGPANAVTGLGAMVTGGSAQETITSGAAFSRVVVASPGMDDYYELTVPSGTTTPVILRAATILPDMNLPVLYAVGDQTTLGAFSSSNVRIIKVGTGDVQVSVSWGDSSDVDLHVIDPSGEEIFYGHKTSASNGTLDLDSNAACSRNADGTFRSNENVVWPHGAGPHGTYTVKLDYWSNCGLSAPTQYVVTVATAGSSPQTFSGSFSGTGDQGGASAGTQITTFTF